MLTAAVCSSSSVPRTWAEAAPGQARGHQQGADVQTHKVPSLGLHFPICEMGCYRERARSKWLPWGCKQHICCQDHSLHPWATALASGAYSRESSRTRPSSAPNHRQVPLPVGRSRPGLFRPPGSLPSGFGTGWRILPEQWLPGLCLFLCPPLTKPSGRGCTVCVGGGVFRVLLLNSSRRKNPLCRQCLEAASTGGSTPFPLLLTGC